MAKGEQIGMVTDGKISKYPMILDTIQILLGLITVIFSGALVNIRGAIATRTDDGLIIPQTSLDYTLELILIIFGLLIIISGFLQIKAHVKYAWQQIISGFIIAIISIFLKINPGIYWNTNNTDNSTPYYYLTYLLLAMGVTVLVFGFIQLISYINIVNQHNKQPAELNKILFTK